MKTIQLLPAEGQFYKANLHCHSTLSDGRLTPAQLKEIYKSHGYAVLCITDHEVLLDHSDLNDPDFLALTGYEIAVNQLPDKGQTPDWSRVKCCHINLYSPQPDYTKYVCFDKNYVSPHAREQIAAGDLPAENYTRRYTVECVNEMVRMAHEAGFLCSYNHPVWSLETPAEYVNYRGFDMMEVTNYGCVVEGYDEYNTYAYDQMLRAGRRLACSATDDNHNAHPVGDPRCDSFGGFVYIKAPALRYADIWQALRYGDFYASDGGPRIHTLTASGGPDGGEVCLTCDGAQHIRMATGKRLCKALHAADGGPLLQEARFSFDGSEDYLRFETIGPDGKRSFTRAYFLDEMDWA